MTKQLIILAGPPACGKTTWANNFETETFEKFENRVKVNTVSKDDIRLHLLQPGEHYWAHENEVMIIYIETLIQSIIDNDITIADAAHLSVEERHKLVAEIQRRIPYISFKTKLKFYLPDSDSQQSEEFEIMKKRNSHRSNRRKVDSVTFLKMYNEYAPYNNDGSYSDTDILRVK